MYRWHVQSAAGRGRPSSADIVRVADGISGSLRQFHLSTSWAAEVEEPGSIFAVVGAQEVVVEVTDKGGVEKDEDGGEPATDGPVVESRPLETVDAAATYNSAERAYLAQCAAEARGEPVPYAPPEASIERLSATKPATALSAEGLAAEVERQLRQLGRRIPNEPLLPSALAERVRKGEVIMFESDAEKEAAMQAVPALARERAEIIAKATQETSEEEVEYASDAQEQRVGLFKAQREREARLAARSGRAVSHAETAESARADVDAAFAPIEPAGQEALLATFVEGAYAAAPADRDGVLGEVARVTRLNGSYRPADTRALLDKVQAFKPPRARRKSASPAAR
ncbi:MAG: hypothetical protein M1832_004123 [Thelocarpon impressellum]|nr:MAG: hypothetical protein M1832_004123 [Thelocarpon impressellum]